MIPLRCLKAAGQRWAGIVAGQHVDIKGGESQTFSSEIAEKLLAKRDNSGKALFEKAELDTAEIQEALGLQLQWKQWPSL